jgi:hypothetical protein
MLKILREYSYLLSLGCSFFLVFFLYLAGWLPEDILHDLEEKSVSAEHITFMEKEDFIPEFIRNPGNTETETDLLQIEEFPIEELLAKEAQQKEVQKEEIREEKSGKEGEPLGENSDLEVEKAGDLESGIPEAANGKENPPATEKIHADKKEELQERIEKEVKIYINLKLAVERIVNSFYWNVPNIAKRLTYEDRKKFFDFIFGIEKAETEIFGNKKLANKNYTKKRIMALNQLLELLDEKDALDSCEQMLNSKVLYDDRTLSHLFKNNFLHFEQ